MSLRLVPLTAALAVALVGGLAASAATPARVLQTANPVEGLAMDGSTVAVMTAFSPGRCERVLAWNPARPTLRGLGRTGSCPASSTGRSVLFAGVAGTRAAWVTDVGGNQRESALWIASLTRPKEARRVLTARRDADSGGGDYVGHVHGDASLLVYSTWIACDGVGEVAFRACPPAATPRTPLNGRLWRLDGASGKRTLLASAPDELAVLGVAAGRILVARGNGSLEVRRAGGQVLRTFAFALGEVRGAVLGPADLVVAVGPAVVPALGATLELRVYDPVSGALKRTLRAPAGAPVVVPRCTYPVGSSAASCRAPLARFRLQDADARRVVSVLDTSIVLTALVTGSEQRIGTTGRGPVFAQLEAAGLVHSYRMTTRHKGRVQFVPARQLR